MHLFETYALKLHVLIHLFAAGPRCKTIPESHKLQTSTYIHNLHSEITPLEYSFMAYQRCKTISTSCTSRLLRKT